MEPFEGYQRDGREFLVLQPRDRVAMLRVNTTEFFREEFTWKRSLVPRGEKAFIIDQ